MWPYVVAFGDAAVFLLSYVASFLLRFGDIPQENFMAFRSIMIVGILIAINVNSLYGLYDRYKKPEYTPLAVSSACTGTAVVMAASFFFRAFALPRSVVLIACPLLTLGYIGVRMGGRTQETATRFTRIDIDQISIELNRTGEVLVEPEMKSLILGSGRLVYDELGPKLLISSAIAPHQAAVKRILDVIAGITGCVALIAIGTPMAIAIWLDSGLPIFYTQPRVGRGGRVFRMVKFRTMVNDAEAQSGPILASRDDARVTRVGRLLRLLRVDEIPQSVNVLMGQMSLVGPRPERPELHEEYARRVAGYEFRTLVRPGLTGLAQIMGSYTSSPEEKTLFDITYVLRYSVWLDLVIITRTFAVLLQPARTRGAQDPRVTIHRQGG